MQVFITGVWESQIIITMTIIENGLWHGNASRRGSRCSMQFPNCYQLSFQVANSMEVAQTTGGHRGNTSFICSHQKYFFAILNTKPTNIWNQPPIKFREVLSSFHYEWWWALTITRWRETPIRTIKSNNRNVFFFHSKGRWLQKNIYDALKDVSLRSGDFVSWVWMTST